MSPIAIGTAIHPGASPGTKPDISRRPSPWHDIAHSLSETTLSTSARRYSSPCTASATPTPPLSCSAPPHDNANSDANVDGDANAPSPALSSSALREWDRMLADRSTDARRHQLVHPTPPLRHAPSSSSMSLSLVPKLAAERDKDGHIEYKLKLIDPTPERFEKLVTQMLWRLKQGRNEAIYELGLADDGTVVGLTRAEMDASLRTLELMASEVGATVIILKEIVLTSAPPPAAAGTHAWSGSDSAYQTPDLSTSASSSALSVASRMSFEVAWPVKRPDLDADGQPRKSVYGGKKGRHRVRARRQRRAGEMGDRGDGGDAENAGGVQGDDEDIPPFHLDLDDAPSSPIAVDDGQDSHVGNGKRIWPEGKHRFKADDDSAHPLSRRPNVLPMPPLPMALPLTQKSALKIAKAAERREQRRMDLIRGDGTNLIWADIEAARSPTSPTLLMSPTSPSWPSSPTAPTFDALHTSPTSPVSATSSPASPPFARSLDAGMRTHAPSSPPTPPAPPAIIPPATIPHQPARPSSLRLATPAPPIDHITFSSSSSSSSSSSPTDPFLAELLLLPLDNLSLSFAEVQTVTDPSVLTRRHRSETISSGCSAGSSDSTTSISSIGGSGGSGSGSVRRSAGENGTAYAPSGPCSTRDATEANEAAGYDDVAMCDNANVIRVGDSERGQRGAAGTSAGAGAGAGAGAVSGAWEDLGSPGQMQARDMGFVPPPPPAPAPAPPTAPALTPGLTGREREMICVEALVVRKTAEGVAGVSERCGDGDDAWGFGDEEDEEGHGAGEDEEEPDGWGL